MDHANPATPLPSLTDAAAAEYPGMPPGHLDTATLGVPPARTAAALHAAVDAWSAARPCADAFEEAVVAAPCPDPAVPARLRAAGIRFASRAGNLRLAPHLHNTRSDVDAVLAALRA